MVRALETGLNARTQRLQQAVTSAISRSVVSELAKVGYARLSMDAVAKKAGVGKAALYRRWPTKQAMVMALLSEIGIEIAESTDTGTLRGDVVSYLLRAHTILQRPATARILPDLYAEMSRDPAFARAVREAVQEPKRIKAAQIIERGRARGEVPAQVDTELALDILAGPLYWRLIATKGSMSEREIEQLADMTVAALTCTVAPRKIARQADGSRK